MVLALAVTGACAAGTEATTTTAGWALSDLVGTWRNQVTVLRVGDDGSYLIAADPDDPDLVTMSGFIARDGDEANFVTVIGGECSGTVGVYRVGLAGTGFSLTLVDDPCQFRSSRFPGEWTETGSASSRSRATRSW